MKRLKITAGKEKEGSKKVPAKPAGKGDTKPDKSAAPKKAAPEGKSKDKGEDKNTDAEKPAKDTEKKQPLFKLKALPEVNEEAVIAQVAKGFVQPVETLIADLLESIQGQVPKDTYERVVAASEKIKQQVLKKAKPLAKEVAGMLATGINKVKLK